ncbi:MAG: YdeI/OmpD-associated family protein [Myxococcales bacterium]|nr:YdeI/OmpD-associated family protein [Myxococcales bacterium]
MTTYATADEWYADCDAWHDEVATLRTIVLRAGLTETLKWKQPCYTDEGKNIVIVTHRKDCALVSFLKGALVDDPRARFVQPGSARSARYVPFTSVEQIRAEQTYLETLIAEAVELQRAGLRVEPLPDDIEYVEELRQRLSSDEAFRVAFEALTVGRRRGYNLHFAKAKQSATREARIERCTERILAGKGLLDCICGRSKRYPRCDGSHKHAVTTTGG